MTLSPQEAETTAGRRRDVFRMSEFDAIAAERSVGEVLHASLESALAQLRVVERRAQRAQRRADELGRVVRNWHELIDDYERATGTTVDRRTN